MRNFLYPFRLCCIVLTFCLSVTVCAPAQDDNLRALTASRHFQVMAFSGCDTGGLLRKINYNYTTSLDNLAVFDTSNQNTMLGKTLDAIFAEASEILDVNIYSYKGTICIYPDKNAMNRALADKIGYQMNESSYYFKENNTIYMAYDSLTLGMLGHEIAHAIIANYFVVPPPAKMHEILSGYVEYSLRKSNGMLP